MPEIFRTDHLPAGGSRKTLFFRMDELPSKEQINPNNYPAIERLRRMMDENCTTGKGNFTEGRRKDC